MASTTNKVSSGWIALLIAAISFIICSSIAKRPAVSTITTSLPLARASRIAFIAISTGFLFSNSMYTGTPTCSPTTRNCSIAAGRYTSQAANNGFLFFLVFNKDASLPVKVVLPEPCKPDINIMAGFPCKFTSTAVPPIKLANSS